MLSITAGLPDAAVNLHLNELAAAQRPCLDIIGKILGAIPTAQLAEELSNRIGDGDVLDVKVWRKDDLRMISLTVRLNTLRKPPISAGLTK